MAKWQNRQRLLSKLNAYPDSVRARIKPALQTGAEQIVSMQRAVAPTLSSPARSRIAGALKQSIDWAWGRVNRGVLSAATGTASAAGDFVISIFAGNAAAFYARFVEFGTKSYTAGDIRYSLRKGRNKVYGGKVKRTHAATRAQPFFYQAFRVLLPGIKRNIQSAVRAATKSIASR